MTPLSIIFISNRKDAKFDWFYQSLFRLLKDSNVLVQLIYVDYWHGQRDIPQPPPMQHVEFIHIPPLPSYCQGKHKITKQDWFSATIMRNTGLVYAIHNYCVFCDDLSVLQNGWLQAVTEAAKNGEVIQGAYRKDLEMVVENGVIKSSKHNPHGQDSRARYARGTRTMNHADWCYGNIGVPLNLALRVNGWDELCSITSYEDAQFGQRLAKAGAKFVYDTRMLSVESTEDHFIEGNYFARQDPETTKERYEQVFRDFGAEPVHPHNGRYDASHVIVGLPRAKSEFGAYWNSYFLRDLRKKRESGEQITVEDMKFPEFWWFDGQPLTEL